MSDYFQHSAINQSLLKHILESEEAFGLAKKEPFAPTANQILGTAVHRLILEPHLSHTLLKLPKLDMTTRLGKMWNYVFKEKKPDDFFFVFDKDRAPRGKKTKPVIADKYVITPDEFDEFQEIKKDYMHLLSFEDEKDILFLNEEQFDTAHAMAQKIRQNTDAAFLLECCSAFEKEYYFEFQNIQMKAKIDAEGLLPTRKSFLLDLKTTGETKKSKLPYVIDDWKYAFQAAFYLLATGGRDLFFIIFVSSKKPYTVFPVQISQSRIQKAFEEILFACKKYNDCLINNPEFITNNKIELI